MCGLHQYPPHTPPADLLDNARQCPKFNNGRGATCLHLPLSARPVVHLRPNSLDPTMLPDS